MSPADRSASARKALLELNYLTPQEVADGVGVHINTVLRAIDAGVLRAGAPSSRRRKDGRPAGPYRLLWTDVEAWLYRGSIGPQLPTPEPGAGEPQPQRASGSSRGPRRRSALISAKPDGSADGGG